MTAALLAIAMLLDAALGEPRWLWSRVPHPAVLMGRVIGASDIRWNAGDHRRRRGALVISLLATITGLLSWLVSTLPYSALVEIILAAILLAQRSLCDHVSAVARALDQSLEQGRASVAMIVGRDTAEMDASDVASGAIESAAENLSDGVIAPAFWFLVAGLPGIMVYKLVNTADSMIGYRTPRHEAFGWASARLDDLLNWIPARFTALLIWVVYNRPAPWAEIAADANRHRSPNAGWPEAAAAPALGVALSGPRRYDGALKSYPYVNETGRKDIGAAEIAAATRLLWRTWAAALAVVVLIAVLSFA